MFIMKHSIFRSTSTDWKPSSDIEPPKCLQFNISSDIQNSMNAAADSADRYTFILPQPQTIVIVSFWTRTISSLQCIATLSVNNIQPAVYINIVS